jgi:hypothetical protein
MKYFAMAKKQHKFWWEGRIWAYPSNCAGQGKIANILLLAPLAVTTPFTNCYDFQKLHIRSNSFEEINLLTTLYSLKTRGLNSGVNDHDVSRVGPKSLRYLAIFAYSEDCGLWPQYRKLQDILSRAKGFCLQSMIWFVRSEPFYSGSFENWSHRRDHLVFEPVVCPVSFFLQVSE